jgi:uncharacterized linocin/CFP29 family protein
MMPTSNKQTVGWTQSRWQRMNRVVSEIFGRVPWIRRVLPTGSPQASAYAVSTPKTVTPPGRDAPLELNTSATMAPVYLKRRLRIRPEQTDDEDAIMRLVQGAATRIAQGEDAVLLKGEGAKGDLDKLGVTYDSTLDNVGGLLDAKVAELVPASHSALDVAVAGVSALEGHGCIGTYSAVLSNRDWRSAWNPLPGSPVPQLEQIHHALGTDLVVGSAFLGGGRRAIVFCRDEWGHDLIVATKPAIDFEGWQDGHLILRVEERFLLRIINGNAACVVSEQT